MKVYLHVGTHKTGTTAVQRFAAAHRRELREQGLLYPGFDLVGNRPQRSQLPLVKAVASAGSEQLWASQVPSFLEEVRRWSERESLDVLLSAESLFRANRRTREQLVRALRAHLPSHRVVPMALLRRQDDLADSLYRNYVRAEASPTRVPPTWTDYVAERGKLFRYGQNIGALEELTGSTALLLPYDRATKRQVIPAFFRALGVHVTEEQVAGARANHSFDLVDCLAKIRLHQRHRPERVHRRFERFVQAHPLRTDYSFFGTEERVDFLQAHADHNAAIVERHPALAEVLDPSAPPQFPRPCDEACERLVEDRLRHFEEWRTSRRAQREAGSSTS